jgi:hypothetical protein
MAGGRMIDGPVTPARRGIDFYPVSLLVEAMQGDAAQAFA